MLEVGLVANLRSLSFCVRLVAGGPVAGARSPKVSLYDAASNTYKTTLAKYHATAVQYVIAGGACLGEGKYVLRERRRHGRRCIGLGATSAKGASCLWGGESSLASQL